MKTTWKDLFEYDTCEPMIDWDCIRFYNVTLIRRIHNRMPGEEYQQVTIRMRINSIELEFDNESMVELIPIPSCNYELKWDHYETQTNEHEDEGSLFEAMCVVALFVILVMMIMQHWLN